jgi:hypothetical protein
MRVVGLLFVTACAAHEPTRGFVASTNPPPPTQVAPPPTSMPDNCDDAILAYHELLASGKGPNHPSVVAAKNASDACSGGSLPEMQMHRSSKPPTPCGEAALERAQLLALGKGPNHPALMLVEERLRHCPTATPSADECLIVAREHADFEARGYGPRRPDTIANDAKRALCP